MFNSLPAQTSYFSVTVSLDTPQMYKTAIALDIVRKYLDQLEDAGEDVRLFLIDGYGDKLTFRELCLGYWMVFDRLYGDTPTADQYPAITGFEGGAGLVGWNRPVTDPLIDVPKALKIYEIFSQPSPSYRDKYARLQVIKKLFYRTDNGNRFFTYNDEEYSVLQDENEDFYDFIVQKLEELETLAENDSNKTDSSQMIFTDLNSSLIQSNKFYISFLTSFEQILYKYTKQIFPLRIYGIIFYLYTSYLNIIAEYVKPYHAKLLNSEESIASFKFGKKDTGESVVVDDYIRTETTMQIVSSVFRWIFDNPYDYWPDYYDQTEGKIHESQIDQTTTSKSSNQTLAASNTQNSTTVKINEGVSIVADCKSNEVTLSSYNGIPMELYDTDAFSSIDISTAIVSNDDGSYTNTLDRDLVVITNSYTDGFYDITSLSFVNQNLDNTAKYGLMVSDIRSCYIYKDNNWTYVYTPDISESSSDLSSYFTDYTDLVNLDASYTEGEYDFVRFIGYIPANSTFYLPKINFEAKMDIL